MEKFANLPVIKKVFSFSLDMFDFCETLKSSRKKIFADKIINSTLVAALSIQSAFETEKKSVYVPAIKRAEKEFKNAIYWVKLYEKAAENTAKDELIHNAEELIEFCELELKKYE